MLRRSLRSMKGTKDTEPPDSIQDSSTNSKKNSLSMRDRESLETIKKNESSNKVFKKTKRKIRDSSSSESDIEDYLQPIDKIDLNSSFFNIENNKEDVSAFNKIEKEIFSGVSVSRLSDSESSDDDHKEETSVGSKEISTILENNKPYTNEEDLMKSLKEGDEVARLNFQKLKEYTKKIEEAKESVEKYKAKHAKKTANVELKTDDKIKIEDLLAAGESKLDQSEFSVNTTVSSSQHSSSYETYSGSEQEDWEEINEKENVENVSLPKKELEIVVEMPSTVKKKKGDDFLCAIKRRLNRRRKENQVLIHKVHLLCWIGHGNYVNSILNDQNMMGLGLSLIPSEKCYPSGRIDLDYLEQILKWYKKTIKIVEKVSSKHKSLNEALTEQIDKKEANSKKMLVLIFIIILRALGIECRLILSLQVEPLRPPSSDLHFLGNQSDSKKKKAQEDNPKNLTETKQKLKVDDSIAKVVSAELSVEMKKSIIKEKLNLKRGGKNEKSTLDEKKLNKELAAGTKSSNNYSSSSKGGKSLDNKSENKKEKYIVNTGNDKKTPRQSTSTSRTAGVKRSEKHIDSSSRKETVKKSQNIKRDDKMKEKQIPTRASDSKSVLPKSEIQESQGKKYSKDAKHEAQARMRKNTRSKSPINNSHKNVRSKSTSMSKVNLEITDGKSGKVRSKSTSDCVKNRQTIPQVDGSAADNIKEFKGFEKPTSREKTLNANFEDFYSQVYNQISEGIVKNQHSVRISQLDGTADEATTSKPNLKNLKKSSNENSENCRSRSHRHTKKLNYATASSSDSDDYFEESPTKKIKVSEREKIVKGRKSTNSKSERTSRSGAHLSVNQTRKINLQKLKDVKNENVNPLDNSSTKTMDVTKDIMQLIKGRIAEQKQVSKSRMVKKRPVKKDYDSDDSDYVPEVIKKKHKSESDNEFCPKMKVKKRVEVHKVKKIKKPKESNSRKVISSDSEYTEEEETKKPDAKKKKGNDIWLEVFLETEEKWISVDVIFGQVHCINELYSRASHPVSYVLAWSNNNYIKDITKRYCQNYNTVTRKLRTDSQWWEQTLKPFLGPKNARDKEEDDELDRQQLDKPLPTTISEYKNHPLYALERHLLKFEALYPPNLPQLGFVRNEPVYSRDCVYICHSRDIWLKQAKVVKLGEKPYKIVKARPKYDKLSNTMITDQNLEIFGPWQVEDYDPPTAENGVVPRNAFGNVDLFKSSMLPKKCVHLQLPGLNKIARRMNIDCASAIVGFDYHGGWSHPVYDGFVVCEEFEDELVAAWNIEQEEIEKKEQEKYEKRVYGNWKKLIKGLFIRERLKAKYGFGQEDEQTTSTSSSNGGKEKKTSKGPTFCTKKRRRISSDSSDDDKK
ncbi:hypothetical protein HHI36_001007 [Cryptolaemus montrouzieri]|uniref:Uncharacterized protein n=1 Tax=Cryptolaemus montrouzieri TaxID=559131 RepID=A0ABD2P717_9CUCU